MNKKAKTLEYEKIKNKLFRTPNNFSCWNSKTIYEFLNQLRLKK